MPCLRTNWPAISTAAVTGFEVSRLISPRARSRDQLTSQGHVQKLKNPAEKGQVTGGKDKTNDAGVGDGGRTGLFPL